MELPSYRIAAVTGSIAATKKFSAATRDIADRLVAWSKQQNVFRDAGPGIKGISVTHADWAAFARDTKNFSPDTAAVAKYASPAMIQGLLVEQGIVALDALSKRYAAPAGGNDGVTIQYTPAGLYAVARHVGPYTTLRQTLHVIFEWLDAGEYTLAEGPVVDLYLNGSETSPAEQLLTDVCVPIKSVTHKARGVLQLL